jgi:hypothetical protein
VGAPPTLYKADKYSYTRAPRLIMASTQIPEIQMLTSHHQSINAYVQIRCGSLFCTVDYWAWQKALAATEIPLKLWIKQSGTVRSGDPSVEAPFIPLKCSYRGPGSSLLSRRAADQAGYSSVGPPLPPKKYQASSRPVGPHDVITGPVLMQYGDGAVTEFYMACLKPGQAHDPASVDLVIGPAMLLKLLHQDDFFEDFFVNIVKNLHTRWVSCPSGLED